ncbi:MAG TPA: hypothetical protein VJR25_10995 [Microbacterium sp.]|uniref:hypothetical protein n=1 Tax=Microbacterium sp. TaxID=51671 RepID=UPI002B490C56|nr:hypothetical protein [Microbacterium sp.]HKT57287.1 hypothetical protein [Microbacterium sp.]
MREFRPPTRWHVINIVGAASYIFASTWLTLYAASHSPGSGLFGVLAIGLGIVWLVRGFVVRASFDEEALCLRNLFRTLRIPRRQITAVDADPRAARVWWTKNSGRRCFATITAAGSGTLRWIPTSTLEHERDFLDSVKRWAIADERV